MKYDDRQHRGQGWHGMGSGSCPKPSRRAVKPPSKGKGCPWWIRKRIQTLPTGTVTFLQSQVELRPCPAPRLDKNRAGCCPSSTHTHKKLASKSIDPHPCAPAQTQGASQPDQPRRHRDLELGGSSTEWLYGKPPAVSGTGQLLLACPGPWPRGCSV